MPELPEVETVCRGLEPIIVGQKFTSILKRRDKLRIDIPKNLDQQCINSKIVAVIRRAKYILIELENENILVVHLGMSGQFTAKKDYGHDYKKHDHVIFELDNGYTLVYNDPRRFGLITFTTQQDIKNHRLFNKLGIEPFEEDFTSPVLYEKFRKKSIPIKNAIMDNHILVGVGNIYACESLFRSKISPVTPANEIGEDKVGDLIDNIKNVLSEAIASGGSTLKDYVNSKGESGYFQHNFAVYDRDGQNCNDCNNEIKRIKQGGRSTFYCPSCQG